MTYLVGALLTIQVYMLGYTYYLPNTLSDTSFLFLYFIQYLLIGCTIAYLFKSHKERKLLEYGIIAIPLLFFASYRWIFLNEFLMHFFNQSIPRKVTNILFVPRVSEISWLALGGIMYIVVTSLITNHKKN